MQGEFRGDFSRDTFDPLKHFRRVFMQQGRVQLDADWNEQTSILLHYMRTLAVDLIGPQGGPASNLGFQITPVSATKPLLNDFQIGAGHYYVDGILCEVDPTPVPITFPAPNNVKKVQVSDWMVDGKQFQKLQYVEVVDEAQTTLKVAQIIDVDVDKAGPILTLDVEAAAPQNAKGLRLRRVITYLTQPDYPVPDTEKLKGGTQPPAIYQVYLDVWERHITYVEDDSIREVALGGPDTASRAKVVWQVKVTTPCVGSASSGTPPCCTPAELGSRFQPDNRGRLKAKARQNVTPADDPCIISPESRYRGAENQLYRVEIHRAGLPWSGATDKDGNPAGNAGTASTFKWSRENSSVVFPILSGAGTNIVTLENLGRDDRFGLTEGDWVEVQDDDSVLRSVGNIVPGLTSNLLQVQVIDRDNMKVTLNGMVDPKVGQDLTKHPLLRRWDQKEGDPSEGGLQLANDGAALIQETTGDTWLDLEDGIQIQFQPSDNPNQPNQYRTGDYWLIPARTATGDVEWPREAGIDSQGNATVVPIAKPPDGIEHHYAPLAVIKVDGNGGISPPSTCQKTFNAIGK